MSRIWNTAPNKVFCSVSFFISSHVHFTITRQKYREGGGGGGWRGEAGGGGEEVLLLNPRYFLFCTFKLLRTSSKTQGTAAVSVNL
jgi:hypothetical protein